MMQTFVVALVIILLVLVLASGSLLKREPPRQPEVRRRTRRRAALVPGKDVPHDVAVKELRAMYWDGLLTADDMLAEVRRREGRQVRKSI